MAGYGVGGAVLIGDESTPGTLASSFVTIPFTSEDLKGSRALGQSGTITGRRSQAPRLKGRRSGTGGISQDVDGSSFGYLFNKLNGTASGARTSASLPGRVSSAPTAAAASGGDLATGAYSLKIATVLQRTLDGSLWVMPASAAASVTLTSGNQTVDLSWTNPVAFPRGFTLAGTVIYRSLPAGSAGSERFAHYVSGSGNSYSLADVSKFNSLISPLVATAYLHEFVEAFSGTDNPLPAFSCVVKKDIAEAHAFLLCRMNSLELAIGDGDSPVTAKWGMMARDFTKIANPAHSLTDLQKFMSWQSVVGTGGVYNEKIESLTLSVNNGGEMVPGLSGQARYRDIGYGVRDIGVQFNRGAEDNSMFDYMRAGDKFDVAAYTWGGPLATAASGTSCAFASTGTNGAGEADVQPLAYMLMVEAFQLSLSEAGGNVGGFGRIIEAVNGGAERDATAGTDLRVTLINLTSSY